MMSPLLRVEEEIIAGVNRARALAGLREVTPDPLLTAVARAYSQRMAELAFFSHTSPDAGLSTPSDRVAAAGGAFRAVGENIAVHPEHRANAQEFVRGWIESKGHRENLMAPEWEQTGAGVFEHCDGQVFATQLFGIPHRIMLDPPELGSATAEWYFLRVTAKIGRGYSIAAFVNNRFVTSADADAAGLVEFEVELPSGRTSHVGFGRRKKRSDDGWIGVYEGFAVAAPDESAAWSPNGPGHSGCEIRDAALFRVEGMELIAALSGQAKVAVICVADGEKMAEYPAGQPFRQVLRFRAGSGTRSIDIGIPEDDGRYIVYARYLLDTAAGSLITA